VSDGVRRRRHSTLIVLAVAALAAACSRPSVVTTVSVPAAAAGVAVTNESLWVIAQDGDAALVLRVARGDGTVRARVAVTGRPMNLVATPDAVWVASCDGLVHRIDPRANAVVASIATGRPACSLAAGGDAIWVGVERGVGRIDPRTNAVVAVVAAGASPNVTFGDGAVWAASPPTRSLTRIDPLDNRAGGRMAVPGVPLYAVVGAGEVWVVQRDATLPTEGPVNASRVDPAMPSVRGAPVRLGMATVAFGGGAFWIARQDGNVTRLGRVNPASLEPLERPRRINDIVRWILWADGSLWAVSPKGAEGPTLVRQIQVSRWWWLR
jgi:ligand-binding sensor domain-containing protein